jgi:hypothetical protein
MTVEQRAFEPCCLPTTLGSLPHADAVRGADLVFEHTPEIPAWPQLPRRTFYENMMIQFTEGLPGRAFGDEKVYFDTTLPDYVDQLTDFYARYLAATEGGDEEALDSFGISADYAAGFPEFLSRLPEMECPLFLKGQVTGPFTLGTNLLDQDDRCSYYDEQLRDVVVKSVAMKAVWQMVQMQRYCPRTMVFADEPALLGFGSQIFLTVSREDITNDLNEVARAIHGLGGLAGVHCEENTDWSLLMETELDILDFDAYDHMQSVTLYPAELRAFLDRGGILAWGIVPTLDRAAAASETVESLLERLDAGMEMLLRKGFEREQLLRQALITPSCGAGGVLDEPLAERVLSLLRQVSYELRRRHGFA